MALSAGARLGPYELISLTGAGGMGEVYRAKDTRLDRTVAIKVLPARTADDPEQRERLDREARAISSLNSPNICALFDVGHQDGVDYLVMEYLEGETLADRLSRKVGSQNAPLPLKDVLRYAIEIAGALDKAHRAGFVHRDLKPGNIMLTKSGAKLLDFGLAKRHEPEARVAAESLSAPSTRTGPLTGKGMILGTLQYMAPEQLEGKATDARTDIFALGAVIYEMATGRRAFEATSQASLIAAILDADPPAISTLQPMTPPALEHVVKVCLAKDPDERWQAAGDVARELKWISEASSQAGMPAPVKARAKRHTAYLSAATALFALTAGVLAFVHLRETPVETSRTRLFILPPEHVASPVYNQIESPPVVSPDGRQIAFVAHAIGGSDSVWVRPLDALVARVLPGTDGVAASSSRPFWSPDSRSLAFFAGGQLKRIAIAGGPPQVLCEALDGRGGTWNEQGTIVFAPDGFGALSQISATGGAVTPATKLAPTETSHRWPMFLPDGRHFLYTSRTENSSGAEVASLDSADVRHVLNNESGRFNVAYANTDQLLFARVGTMGGGTLFAQSFDHARLALAGQPVVIAEQVAMDGGGLGATFSISTNGVLVYRQEAPPASVQPVWFDRTGRRLGTVGPPANQSDLSLSPDGTRVAVTRELAQRGLADIWLLSVASGTASRFTFDSQSGGSIWSPDGRLIAVGTYSGLVQKASSGRGEAEVLVTTGALGGVPTDWSRDGRFIVYAHQDSGSKMDLWALPLSGDREPIELVRTDGWDGQGQFSPDGRWLAYTSDVSGRVEVYVQAFPAAGGKWQVSASGGTQPRWRGDGKELFYIGADNQLMAATVKPGAESFDTGVQQPLFGIRVAPGDSSSFAVTPDGQRFLVNTVVNDPSQPIVVVLNWAAALK